MSDVFPAQVSKALYWLERQTHIRTNHARMLCGKDVGACLAQLIRDNGYAQVLEIGAFTGYSTICLASALPQGGHVDSLEINDELTSLILQGYELAGLSDKISLHIGDALKLIPELASKIARGEQPEYDFIYIDANKRYYSAYYEAVMPLLRKGGMIVADNVLWSGKALDPSAKPDAQTVGIKNFNSLVASDPRVEAQLVDLRDGLYIIKKI